MAAFLDHDAMPTTKHWHAQLVEAIAFRPDAGALVAVTNRIASPWQQCGDRASNDMAMHRKFGEARRAVRTLLDVTATKGFGGVLFALARDTWAELGGFADGFGCVDHSWHFKCQAAGRRVFVVEGLYVFHWRHYGEPDTTSLFPKAPNCPCRGREEMPHERVTLR